MPPLTDLALRRTKPADRTQKLFDGEASIWRHPQQVKALHDRGDPVYVVSASVSLYPAFPMPVNTVICGKVYLRNRIDRLN
jgi:hypothetical protein